MELKGTMVNNVNKGKSNISVDTQLILIRITPSRTGVMKMSKRCFSFITSLATNGPL